MGEADLKNAGDRLLDCNKPKKFQKSVDVLNHVFGVNYLGREYKGWQQGGLKFSCGGTDYLIWFPILSDRDAANSPSGWINYFNDDCSVIYEKPVLDKLEDTKIIDAVRFVFSKGDKHGYCFNGVYILNKNKSDKSCRVYNRVAKIADLTGKTPKILYSTENGEADKTEAALESIIKSDTMETAPSNFDYTPAPKEKQPPIMVENRKVYCRDRQTAVNALAHAGFKCEIDNCHPTFIRRNSDKPYTEPHHLIPMAYSDEFINSLDVEANIVSLCSNCHNQIHYGKGAEKLLEKLYNKRKDALKKSGIEISLEKLLSYYK